MMDQKSKFSPKGIIAEFIGEDQIDKTAITRVMKGQVHSQKYTDCIGSVQILYRSRKYRPILDFWAII